MHLEFPSTSVGFACWSVALAVALVLLRWVFSKGNDEIGCRFLMLFGGAILAIIFCLTQSFIDFIQGWLQPERHAGTLGYYFSLGAFIWDVSLLVWLVLSVLTGILWPVFLYASGVAPRRIFQ